MKQITCVFDFCMPYLHLDSHPQIIHGEGVGTTYQGLLLFIMNIRRKNATVDEGSFALYKRLAFSLVVRSPTRAFIHSPVYGLLPREKYLVGIPRRTEVITQQWEVYFL